MNYFYWCLHFTIYRWVLVPISIFLVNVLSPFFDKLGKGIELRRKKDGHFAWQNIHFKGALWIHVSSGEFEYAKPVIASLKAKSPELKIVVSYFSPSVQKSLTSDPLIDGFFPLPFDHPLTLGPVFKHLKPKMLLVARTDLWPELLIQARRFCVRSVLFSVTLSAETSKTKNLLKRSFAKWRYKLMDQIFCVEEADQMEFSRLGLRVEVLGDTRYDQVVRRLKHPKPLRSELAPTSDYTTFLAGSTWFADEEVLKHAIVKLYDKGVRFVLAPHEPSPDHLAHLKRRLSNFAQVKFYTEATSDWYKEKKPTVLVVNQVGILADLYSWAQLGFVGNCFERDKIHSVMEPLASGLITFVGPKHRNNREAQVFQSVRLKGKAYECAAVTVFNSAEELIEKIKAIPREDLPAMKSELQSAIRDRTGASDRLAQWILS
jgi:3-deoxy-D-manno-octulosonic-acid transferase